uniref:NB-ARC domain-containing protein n=1 Tax=Solanum lycopersicum TaxID=4081 RepID=K4B854_SOLLC
MAEAAVSYVAERYIKQEEDEAATIRYWVSEIRAVAYHAEDVIEIFIQQVESQKRQSFFIKCIFYPKKLYGLYKVGKEIESIQTRILEISNSLERYGIRHIQGLRDGEGSSTTREKMRERRLSSPLIEDKRLRVASIVGMGGVGKTTLAKEVYNQTQIREKFDIRAWLYVSQDYKPMKIIKELILQLASPEEDKVKIVDTMDKLSQAGLEEMLQRRLKDTCYLIVLDDIWTQKHGISLLDHFLTTISQVDCYLPAAVRRLPCMQMLILHFTNIKYLSKEESWELFLKIENAEDREFPHDLVGVGKEILEKCDGLPLAITVIGGLLAVKVMVYQQFWH